MTDRIGRAFAAAKPHFDEARGVSEAQTRRSRAVPPARRPAGVESLMHRPHEAELGAKLDQFLRSMQGPYQVEGRTVSVPAAFRSLHAVSPKDQQKFVMAIKREIGAEQFEKIARNVLAATSTRGTPDDVRVTTQALIDAGAASKVLGANPRLSPEQAVRVVMSAFGIGFDCRGYVLRSVLQSRGKGGSPAAASAYFERDVGSVLFQHDHRLRRVSADLAMARTGDIVRLKPDHEGRDHNVIVRSNDVREVPKTGSFTLAGRTVPEGFVQRGAKVRVLVVDSSWGGGGDPLLGGAERRVWLHDEATGRWGFWDRSGTFGASSRPYEHDVDGVFRPRSER